MQLGKKIRFRDISILETCTDQLYQTRILNFCLKSTKSEENFIDSKPDLNPIHFNSNRIKPDIYNHESNQIPNSMEINLSFNRIIEVQLQLYL